MRPVSEPRQEVFTRAMIRNDTLRRNPGKVSAVQSRSHRLLPKPHGVQQEPSRRVGDQPHLCIGNHLSRLFTSCTTTVAPGSPRTMSSIWVAAAASLGELGGGRQLIWGQNVHHEGDLDASLSIKLPLYRKSGGLLRF